jgi:hypothetical protein
MYARAGQRFFIAVPNVCEYFVMNPALWTLCALTTRAGWPSGATRSSSAFAPGHTRGFGSKPRSADAALAWATAGCTGPDTLEVGPDATCPVKT